MAATLQARRFASPSPEIHALVLDNAKGRGIDPELVARMIGGGVQAAQ